MIATPADRLVRVFPLLEIFNGVDYKLSREPAGTPIRDYIKMQGRFRHLHDEEIDQIQRNVDEEWERLSVRLNASRRKSVPRKGIKAQKV